MVYSVHTLHHLHTTVEMTSYASKQQSCRNCRHKNIQVKHTRPDLDKIVGGGENYGQSGEYNVYLLLTAGRADSSSTKWWPVTALLPSLCTRSLEVMCFSVKSALPNRVTTHIWASHTILFLILGFSGGFAI